MPSQLPARRIRVGLLLHHALALILFVSWAGCGRNEAAPAPEAHDETPLHLESVLEVPLAEHLDDTLRMNQIQVVATHNSYHGMPPAALHAQVKAVYPDAATWEYDHAPLDVQLNRGIRSFELDVHRTLRGYEVFHVQDFDAASTCRDVDEALQAIRTWSKAHPRHVPIVTLIELKKEDVPFANTQTFPFEADDLVALDAQLLSVFSPEELITPDDVRGEYPALAEAVRAGNWPTLAQARGKCMFVLHVRGALAEDYTRNAPSCEGRPMFVEGEGDKPWDAVFVVNEPELPQLAQYVRQGFIVRTRADADLREGRANDTGRRETALASGAQIVSTDFPRGEADPDTGYQVELPGKVAARPNPVTAP
ncbi:MAG: Ca2+-dependent phosphoinositide-specific phospholipase C [Candidatus Hydrogenedentales bacterium]|jgi:hypothetical protein